MIHHTNLKKEFEGKKVLITGGTGSVGIGIIEQLVRCNPKAIRVLTNDENSIFELKQRSKKWPITYMVGDVRDRDRINLAIRDIDIIFHAAAMKHIDICEENPFDAVKTNVLGTSNILEAALIENVSKFILISTDKSTNPSSTLGASKMLAERLTLNAGAYRGNGITKFSIARFGNVFGSRGSVYEIFLNQIRSRTSITVTDQRMTRFVMSISDAASLILKMSSLAKDGETFILKMPSVRIMDLAKEMIKVCHDLGISRKDHPIRVSEARRNERLHELLITDDELPYCHDLGNMYKVTHTLNKKPIPEHQFSSESAAKIERVKLYDLINSTVEHDSKF